jgi:hypothetical protein
MAVDLRSVARAAAEAALGDVAPGKKGLSPWRALAIGAGLVTAGRIATGPGGRLVRELVQGHSSNGSAEDEEPEAEDDHEEPEAEADEEPEAEADEEPEAEDDHEEPEAEADEEPFEQALSPEAAQRRDSESPKSRQPKGRRTAPPRRPRRPRTPAQRA